MYSAPRSFAIASWIRTGSGRVSERVARPSAPPTKSHANPPSPASVRNRRRPGSAGSSGDAGRVRHTSATIPIAKQMSPETSASWVLPSAATMNATAPPSSAKRINERGGSDLTTHRFCQRFPLRPACPSPVDVLPDDLALVVAIRRAQADPMRDGLRGDVVRVDRSRRSMGPPAHRGATRSTRLRPRSRTPAVGTSVPTVHAIAASSVTDRRLYVGRSPGRRRAGARPSSARARRRRGSAALPTWRTPRGRPRRRSAASRP